MADTQMDKAKEHAKGTPEVEDRSQRGLSITPSLACTRIALGLTRKYMGFGSFPTTFNPGSPFILVVDSVLMDVKVRLGSCTVPRYEARSRGGLKRLF